MPHPIPNTKEITSFLHCKLCLQERPEGVSPQDYQAASVGYTPIGLQIWCNRHDCNVIHLDFAGQVFDANTEARLGVAED